MSALAACILLGVFAISIQGVDSADSDFQLLAHKPGDEKYLKKTLTIECRFYKQDVLRHLTQMEIFVSEPGQDDKKLRLGGVSSYGTYKNQLADVSKYSINGKLKSSDVSALLELTWNTGNDGYCKTYTCKAIGVDFNGVIRVIQEKLEAGPSVGSSCGKEEEEESSPENAVENSDRGHVELREMLGVERGTHGPGYMLSEKKEMQSNSKIPGYIQDAFPDATEEQQKEVLDKINSIDNNTYDVSGIYQGRVYLASTHYRRFKLDKMNKLCKSEGGYLVELDSAEEQYFVRDFLKETGHFRYYTGANDVESEGNFVYYNSKKPVTNVVWRNGQPDNWRGQEHCVEVLPNGLNDNRCSRIRGYICEIPLLDNKDEDEPELVRIIGPEALGYLP